MCFDKIRGRMDSIDFFQVMMMIHIIINFRITVSKSNRVWFLDHHPMFKIVSREIQFLNDVPLCFTEKIRQQTNLVFSPLLEQTIPQQKITPSSSSTIQHISQIDYSTKSKP